MTLTLNTNYGTYEVYTKINRYRDGGVLYVGLDCIDKECGFVTPFTDLTVNVPYEFIPITEEQMYMAPIDTNNNPWAEKFLTDNKLATPTNMEVQSGWCTYPIYRFNLKEVEKYLYKPNKE